MDMLKKPIFPIFVVFLLVIYIVYPVPFISPYDEIGETRYAVAHESTEAFDEVSNIDVESPTPVSNLSPATQQVFREAIEQPRDTGSSTRAAGWQPHRDGKVCRPNLLVCDEVPEPPEFPNHGSGGYGFGIHGYIGVVEYEDEVYLVEVNYDARGPNSYLHTVVDFILKSLAFGLYALFLGLVVISKDFQQKHELAFAKIGFALVAVAFSFPYIQMFVGEFQYLQAFFIITGVSWAVAIGGSVIIGYSSQ